MLNLVEGKSGALLACVLSLFGTYLAAVVWFPANPTPRGALVVSAWILTVAIMIVPVLRAIGGGPSATNAENFVALGFVAWLLLDLIQGAYALDEAKDESLRLALEAIGVSAAAMWLGASGRPWRIPTWIVEGVKVPLHADTIVKAVPICFALGMFNFLYSVDFDIARMFSYVGQQRWSVPWGRGQLGGWESFRDQAQYFGYVLPSLTALLIARRGLLSFQSLFSVACSAVMLLFLSTGGGRRVIAVTVGAALMVWIQANPGLRVKNFLVVGFGVIALAWTAQFILNIRSGGYEQYLERGSEYDYLHVDDNFLRLAQVIEFLPSRVPFVRHRQLVFTLVRPIPRILWPGKPISPGFDLPTEIGMKGVSLSTSIIGEWYISYGWFAVVFGGWLHGRLAAMACVLRDIGNQAGNPIVYSLSVMVLMAGMRSMQDLVLMSYALVAWWAVSRYTAPATTPVYGR
ncbi:MAG: O-antigen polymerase [Vicinamibacterales bacterium]|jgi:oligosaccharide repeat unit polymerase